MSTPAAWKATLQPLADLVASPVAWLWDDARTDKELASLSRAMSEPTQTNCAWYVYRAAVLLNEELPLVLEHRERLRIARQLDSEVKS